MTRTLSRRALSTCGVAGVLAGVLVAGAGAAHAAEVPKYGNVRYVFCSDTQDNNRITYYDNLGKREEIASFGEAKDGGVWCRSVDVFFAKETYVWSAVSGKDAHYAYAAIFVNGRMAAREEDRSEFGTYVQAM